MPFDPNLPANGGLIFATELRAQFNALKELFDQQAAQLAALSAQVAAIPAGPPGPQGIPGPANWFIDENDPGGSDGDCWLRPSDGTVFRKEGGAWVVKGSLRGPEGMQGPTGEVSTAQLDAAIGGTSNNTNAVAELDTSGFSDPDALAAGNKFNEFLLGARR